MKYLIDRGANERGSWARLILWIGVTLINLVFWFLLLAYPTILVIGLGG